MAPPLLGSQGPVAVSILVFGESTSLGKQLLRDWDRLSDKYNLMDPTDIRVMFRKDPNRSRKFKAHWERNAEYDETLISLHQFTAFAESVKGIVDDVLSEYNAIEGDDFTRLPMVIPVFCTKGTHRADGVAKTAAHRVLNVLDYGHGRAFNVNVFSLNGATTLEGPLKATNKWLSNPWFMQEPKVDFGIAACASTQRAKFVYDMIGDIVFTSVNGSSGLPVDGRGNILVPDFSSDEEVIDYDEKSESKKRRPSPPDTQPPSNLNPKPRGSAADKDDRVKDVSSSARRTRVPTPPAANTSRSDHDQWHSHKKRSRSPSPAQWTASSKRDWQYDKSDKADWYSTDKDNKDKHDKDTYKDKHDTDTYDYKSSNWHTGDYSATQPHGSKWTGNGDNDRDINKYDQHEYRFCVLNMLHVHVFSSVQQNNMQTLCFVYVCVSKINFKYNRPRI